MAESMWARHEVHYRGVPNGLGLRTRIKDIYIKKNKTKYSGRSTSTYEPSHGGDGVGQQARIRGGGGRDPPPCSRPPIFFPTNFLTIAKKRKKKGPAVHGRRPKAPAVHGRRCPPPPPPPAKNTGSAPGQGAIQ